MDNNFNNGQNQGQQNQGYPNGGYQNRLFLKTDRGLLMYILLSIVTCGIYSLFFFSKVGEDMNILASRRDGKRTMHFCLMFFLVGPITCEIYTLVWWHKLCNRIGDEAHARGIQANFDASTFWLWNILGSLLCGIGPLVFLYKLCKTMNLICADYNQRGC